LNRDEHWASPDESGGRFLAMADDDFHHQSDVEFRIPLSVSAGSPGRARWAERQPDSPQGADLENGYQRDWALGCRQQ
jgi:hypothetical protein